MEHRAFASIDLDNLLYNFCFIKENFAINQSIICMLKANAYGHGAIKVAEKLKDECEYFGVATVDEGIQLRQAGVNHAKILVFSGFFELGQQQALIDYRLIPIVHSNYQFEILKKYYKQQNSEVWLKLNTGMNRLGLTEKEFNAIYEQFQKIPRKVNLVTHLAESEQVDSKFTRQQLNAFYYLIKNKNYQYVSAFNSAATLSFAKTPIQTNMVRIGLALYGISPFEDHLNQLVLKPVMTLYARIIAIKSVSTGESIGYNCRYTANHPSVIATLSIGYGDGYPQVPNFTPVRIHGAYFPSVGKISMDLMAVDITHSKRNIKIGDYAVLFGQGLPVEFLSEKTGISRYLFTTNISDRVARIDVRDM